MTTKMIEKNALQVSINSKNQLVIDMPVKQMNALFKKHTGRSHRSTQEVENFINNLVRTKLIERGLISKK